MKKCSKLFSKVKALCNYKDFKYVASDKSVIYPIVNTSGKFVFYCPGCNNTHTININPANAWPCHTLTGSLEKPTVRASVYCRGNKKNNTPNCHSFITKGKISFLYDCTHDLAGKTVELKPIM